MSSSSISKQPFFSAQLDQRDLEQILQRVDENLAKRPAQREAGEGSAALRAALVELGARLENMQSMQAPLYVVKGRDLPNLLKRLLNLPIKLFGRKQISFNSELLDALAQTRRLLQEATVGHHEWIMLLDRKLQMLALDVREGRAAPPAAELPEPQILDPASFARKLAAMEGGARVNLGCGEKPLPGYLNIDFRPLPGADVVADVRRLPFEPASLGELASAHLIEHFREHQLRSQILPYWRSLLRPDGALRIICPNWQAMLARLDDGRMDLDTFKLLTFGAQDYVGDDHFAMYTPETLTRLLREGGFGRVEIVTPERMNGLCPEMEILAQQ